MMVSLDALISVMNGRRCSKQGHGTSFCHLHDMTARLEVEGTKHQHGTSDPVASAQTNAETQPWKRFHVPTCWDLGPALLCYIECFALDCRPISCKLMDEAGVVSTSGLAATYRTCQCQASSFLDHLVVQLWRFDAGLFTNLDSRQGPPLLTFLMRQCLVTSCDPLGPSYCQDHAWQSYLRQSIKQVPGPAFFKSWSLEQVCNLLEHILSCRTIMPARAALTTWWQMPWKVHEDTG